MINSSDILKASILIVDDQEAHSSLLKQILSGAGYPQNLGTRSQELPPLCSRFA
jgi:CheY-like chemotaxis protein